MRAWLTVVLPLAVTGCGARYAWTDAGSLLAGQNCPADAGPYLPTCPAPIGAWCDQEQESNHCLAGPQCAGATVLACTCQAGCPPPESGCSGCARSRAALKQDIRLVGDAQLQRYREELVTLPLATWRYRDEGPAGKERLGFMLDEAEGLVASDAAHDRVDLYSYTSMAVATLKVQQQQIDQLQRELGELRRAVKACAPAGTRQASSPR